MKEEGKEKEWEGCTCTCVFTHAGYIVQEGASCYEMGKRMLGSATCTMYNVDIHVLMYMYMYMHVKYAVN